jgi:hypothetical protein
MKAPLADRAGGDRPHRRTASTRWLASRVALLALTGMVLGAIAGEASAQVPPPTSPVVIGPGPAVPPPAPSLPGDGKGGSGGSGQNGKGGQGKGGQGKGGNKGDGSDDLFASCAPFSYTQTYAAWGPAVAYGGPVTVVYQADRCSTPDGPALDIAAEGTASVYEGLSADGTLLETRPFVMTGTWKDPKNAEAWPPPWWSCSVPFASYSWEIPGLYTFRVTAHSGVWSLDVISEGVGSQAVTWSHDGCAA